MIDLVTANRKLFFFFVDKCNETYRSGHDLAIYRNIIFMHRDVKDLSILLQNDDFYLKMYCTLKAWNMDNRGAKLVPFDVFQDSIFQRKETLLQLYKYKLYNDIDDDLSTIKDHLELLFCNLKVMQSRRRIVGVSKTLHFLLPDLIMPIDSKFTMMAFFGYNKYGSTVKKEFSTFSEIFERSFNIAEHLSLSEDDVDDVLWNTSVPKLIDNAIIGQTKSTKEQILEFLQLEKRALETPIKL